MKQRLIPARMTGVLLAYCFLTLSGCQTATLGPTLPSGYRIILPAASQTERLRSLSLTVQVIDADGLPVDDVPVHFRIHQNHTALAEVTPPVVLTQNGRATSEFRARMAGHIAVEITVENLTKTVRISVLGETPRF